MEIIYRKNERETNETAAKAVLFFAGFVVLICILCWTGIFDVKRRMTNLFASAVLIPLLLPAVLVLLLRVNSSCVKYIILTCVSAVAGIAYMIFTFQTVLIFVIPSIIGVFYLEKKVMYYAGAVTTFMIAMSHLVTVRHLYQPWIEPFSGLRPIMLYGALPRIIQSLCCTGLLYLFCLRIREFLNGYQKTLQTFQPEAAKQAADKTACAELQQFVGGLTQREQDVFRLLAQGYTNAQIAGMLYLSNGTVKNYISSIYDKTGIHNRTELVLKFSGFYADYDRSHTI